jgi:hypothetical protein
MSEDQRSNSFRALRVFRGSLPECQVRRLTYGSPLICANLRSSVAKNLRALRSLLFKNYSPFSCLFVFFVANPRRQECRPVWGFEFMTNRHQGLTGPGYTTRPRRGHRRKPFAPFRVFRGHFLAPSALTASAHFPGWPIFSLAIGHHFCNT